MNDAQRARAEAQALLQEYGAVHGPLNINQGAIDVDAIVAYLGLEVALFDPADQPETVYGWLEPGEPLIWLRPGLPEPVRRFTLAHELGHVRLHRRAASIDAREPCQADDFGELEDDTAAQPGGEILGGHAAYSPRSRREREANSFAAALLVPLEMLRACYLGGLTTFVGLANVFGVSVAVIERQLALLLDLMPWPLAVGEEKRGKAAYSPEQERGQEEWNLDETQMAAVRVRAPALIVAGPGTGKTATLVQRIQYLVENGVPPEQILALTFSNKAAMEMHMRLERLLGEHGLLPVVGTFHAFGAEVLRTYGVAVGLRPDFNLLDEIDSYMLLQSLGARLPLEHYQHLVYPALFFPDLLRAISRAKDELVTPEEYLIAAETMVSTAVDEETRLVGLKAREVALVYAAYQQALLERGDADFGDLIMRTVVLLRDYPEIRERLQQRYRYIVVDEFQDINRASGRLLQLLAGDQWQVWVVGDSDQAIYRFRGASPANIRSFEADYPEASVASLCRNYRSVPDIVMLANAGRAALAELSGIEAAPPLEATRSDGGPAVTLATAPTGEAELWGIAAAIARRVNVDLTPRPPFLKKEKKTEKRRWRYRDQVVLCRTREQARAVARILQEAGIPVATPAASLLEYDIVKDVVSLLLLLSEPSGMGLLRATRLPGYEAPRADIEELFHQARQRGEPAGLLFWRREFDRSRLSQEGAKALDRLADLLDRLHDIAEPWALLLHYLFSESDWGRRALEGHVASGDIAAVRALLAHANRYLTSRLPHQDSETEGEKRSAKGLLAYLRTLYQLRQDIVSIPEGEDADRPDVVRVMTIHASKGLEFPVVYVPNLAQGRFPAQNRGNVTPMPPSLGDGIVESQGETHRLEELCLFYVAVTRARDELILSRAEQYGKKRYRPAEFIGIVEHGLGRRLIREEWTVPAWLASSSSQRKDEHDTTPTGGKQEAPSVSAIECYQRCPRQYQYSYQYHLRETGGRYHQLYEAVRLALHTLEEQVKAARENGGALPDEADAMALFTSAWSALVADSDPFDPLYIQEGMHVLAHARQWLVEPATRLAHHATIEVDGQRVRLDIDRIERTDAPQGQPAKTRLIRHRLGSTRAAAMPDMRALLYTLAHRQQAPSDPYELEVHNLSTGERQPLRLSAHKEESLHAQLREALAGIARGDYQPRPDPRICGSCPFLFVCPA
jgi:DNA helicase-2/ATP-dependent DNA helicase PcrA